MKHENPDAIINIVDATNLSRSLFFTTQLLELGIPVVVALNKSDINAEKGHQDRCGRPVAPSWAVRSSETVSTSAEGLKAVVEAAAGLERQGPDRPIQRRAIST